MVKADAYGHGLLPIVEFSYNQMNIKSFGLASLGEALCIRRAFPQMEADLYVFSDLDFNNGNLSSDYINNRILPVISNTQQLESILNDRSLLHMPLVLKFNTGMNRLGLSCVDKDLEILVHQLKKHNRKTLYHIMSHFACSGLSMKTNKRNISQMEEFQKIKQFFLNHQITIQRTSISNSGAIEQKIGLDETHIRPGLMLYGPSSLIPKYNNLTCWKAKNISKLVTSILQVAPILKGTPIGYGANPVHESGLLAIIAMGYGDGLRTTYQNAKVLCNGHIGQIVGRVNMDMAQVLFDTNASSQILNGSQVEIFGHDTEFFSDFCIKTKTIPYEVFLGITPRISKRYLIEE